MSAKENDKTTTDRVGQTGELANQAGLQNRFEALGDKQKIKKDTFNQILTQTEKEVLGLRKSKKEEWDQEATWMKIYDTKEVFKAEDQHNLVRDGEIY